MAIEKETEEHTRHVMHCDRNLYRSKMVEISQCISVSNIFLRALLTAKYDVKTIQ